MRQLCIVLLLFWMCANTYSQTLEGISKPYSFSIEKEPHYCDKPKAPANLVLEQVRLEDPNDNGILEVGETGKLHLVLLNSGKGHACRIELGVKEQTTPSGMEMPRSVSLNELAPGDQKVFLFEIRGNMHQKTQKSELLLTALEKNGFDADPVKISFQVQAFQAPLVELVSEQFSSPTGNLSPGSEITLTSVVQNLGKGPADQVKVSFRLPAANVLPTGETEFDIGTLKPGQSKTLECGFMVNKRYESAQLPVTVLLSEKLGQYARNKDLNARMNQRVALPREVEVKAKEMEVVEPERVSLVSDVDVNLPKFKITNPDAVALVIGNANYKKTKRVDFAIQDASSIKNYLVEVLGFKEGNILFKTDATLDDFNTLIGTETARGQLSDYVKPHVSEVFVYYSGHGAPDLSKEEEGGQKGYLVPVLCDPNKVANGGYSLETFYRNLNRLNAKSLTVVLDACFSGIDLIKEASPLLIRPKIPVMEKGVGLAASQASQVANWYSEKQHGMLTYFFLKALQNPTLADSDKNGQLTVAEIHRFVSNEAEGVPYWSKRLHGDSRKQNPVLLGGNQNQIVLDYGKK